MVYGVLGRSVWGGVRSRVGEEKANRLLEGTEFGAQGTSPCLVGLELCEERLKMLSSVIRGY